MKASTVRRFGTSREIGWDLLRIYLGFALTVKGLAYQLDEQRLVQEMLAAHVPFASSGLAELVALTHIAGGLLLAFGLLTRFGAAIQIPNVLGAVVFVHAKRGLFTAGETLEFAMFVLLGLVLFAAFGAGHLSVDATVRDNARTQNRRRDAAARLAKERSAAMLPTHA